jgi:hypothetical protein
VACWLRAGAVANTNAPTTARRSSTLRSFMDPPCIDPDVENFVMTGLNSP